MLHRYFLVGSDSSNSNKSTDRESNKEQQEGKVLNKFLKFKILSCIINNPTKSAENINEKTASDFLNTCHQCGKVYKWKSTLARHLNVECGGKEPNFQCKYCVYKAKQLGNLKVHIRKHHNEK